MVSHHTVKFGGHRQCGSGVVMLVVVEEQDSTCCRLDQLLLFTYRGHGMPCSYTRNFRT